MHYRIATLPILAAALIASCRGTAPKHTAEEQYFMQEVKPVLEKNCLRCHNGSTLPDAMNLSNAGTAMGKGKGNYIVPGKPEKSLLARAIGRKGNHPKLMPKLDLSLTDMQIGAIREWIQDGAAWPAGPAGELKARTNPENP